MGALLNIWSLYEGLQLSLAVFFLSLVQYFLQYMQEGLRDFCSISSATFREVCRMPGTRKTELQDIYVIAILSISGYSCWGLMASDAIFPFISTI